MRITDEIFQVGGDHLSSPEDAAVYLISYGNHAALIDAGCGYAQSRILANILRCGVSFSQVEILFLTHCHFDHAGGAEALREAIGCRIAAHEIEAPYLESGDDEVTAASWYGSTMMPVRIDIKLRGPRQTFTLGHGTLEAVHAPGHSPGSVVYLTESQGLKVLFAQDVHGPLDSSLLSNYRDYQESLRLLLSLEADILCEGHYGVYRGKERVADFIRGFLSLNRSA
ncbi:MAG: MBL fold metallo-hydrolase [Syntrophobacteraceae bacterium]|nr:MBL fold metallo-hydrolase [Syntrophobacteraceae bacterium]